ncbi:MAG: hypothetical protein MRERV_49c012 [Mycoplasmataceae bacterium RV_VA103A]|nr:MAG: hypothetical protein MRERV_49c012 [Mycoplasmataceae bacterium RV_VA103A]
MTNKIEKNLQFTCPICFSVFQLLEIHEQESHSCPANCQDQWQALLSQHYQNHIILHLAREEAEKDQKKEVDHE